MVNKEHKITKQEYLAAQAEYNEMINHYDKDGFCFFCGKHREDGLHYKCWI
tara:strand:- start:224 stop:376 length:153 start_codon:yes stop_codon:yes gene_type:complete